MRECEVEEDGLKWLALLPRLDTLSVRDDLEEEAKEIMISQ